MPENSTAWYQRTFRWGQTNITEVDPVRYDIDFWVEQWRRTRVQGVIINAGGIVSYYPSQIPLAQPAEYLGNRDLFGELVEAARRAGLTVLARMDSNRVHTPMAQAHPEWIAVDGEGKPYRAGELYISSIFSPYYQQYLPEILKEIASRYHPDGFADNSFSGLGRDRIDYNGYARQSFHQATGLELPLQKDWDASTFRQWIRWNYKRRLEIWDMNNQAAQEAGGADCLWIGMVGSDPVGQATGFRDLKGISERARILLLDSQSRGETGGFSQNTDAGLMLHNLLGWDKLMPESMAMYEHNGAYPFRLASKPELEARLWALSGIAGGIQPWWHHIGAYHEDRRQYHTAENLFQWHEKNQAYLVNRKPIAPVGVVWSQENADFYGRDQAREKIEQPWQGFTRALSRHRLLYQPIHASQIDQASAMGVTILVLPNIGALSDEQIRAIRAFVGEGGSLVASGETAKYDEWGDSRPGFALGDLFGVSAVPEARGELKATSASWEDWNHHTYLRAVPEQRHPVLAGFEETNLLPFGGLLQGIALDTEKVEVPLYFVPPSPVYPPETAWMRQPTSPYPALVVRELESGARLAYLAADIDRCYARNPLPDYARLLANLALWGLRESHPIEVDGAGHLRCCLYQQLNRLILHIVNYTGSDPRPASEVISVGPIQIRVKKSLLSGQSSFARLLVAEQTLSMQDCEGWSCFQVEKILDHEVIVIE